jgi:hypothetical protein
MLGTGAIIDVIDTRVDYGLNQQAGDLTAGTRST